MSQDSQLSLFDSGPPPVPAAPLPVIYSPLPTMTGEVVERDQLPAVQGAEFTGHQVFPVKVSIDEVGLVDSVTLQAPNSGFASDVIVRINVEKETHKLMVLLTLRQCRSVAKHKLGKRVRVTGTATIHSAGSRLHVVRPAKLGPVNCKKKSRGGT